MASGYSRKSPKVILNSGIIGVDAAALESLVITVFIDQNKVWTSGKIGSDTSRRKCSCW